MKAASTIIFALAAVLATAAPAKEGFQGLDSAVLDCAECQGSYDFCILNGHTEGQTGCKQTCREHVCHRNLDCKTCGDPFDKCPEVSRYHN